VAGAGVIGKGLWWICDRKLVVVSVNLSACGRAGGGRRLHPGVAGFSIADLIRLRLPGAELAYLSSCSTAVGAAGVPDEAMHLAAAFSHAGFRYVIASLWPLSDAIAPRVTREFYPRLLGDGRDPGQALREASLALAAEYPGNPSRWACLAHFGT
jgi:CHAT domain-containing protein